HPHDSALRRGSRRAGRSGSDDACDRFRAWRAPQGRRCQSCYDRRAANARPHGVDGRPGRHHHAAYLRVAVHLRRQLERYADAGGEHAGDLERRSRLYDPAAQGREVPQWQGDDVRRCRGVVEAVDGHGAARQGRRQGDQEPRGQGSEFDRQHPQPTQRTIARALGVAEQWCVGTVEGDDDRIRTLGLEAKGPNSIVITLNRPYAPLLAHLALPNGFAAIMPKETIATPLTEYIGTGPYKFKERKPDQYVQLVRYDGYSARKEPASGYAGHREAWIDELRFIPVPNANTRVEGSLSGQYQFADLLPVESYARIENAPNVKPVLTSPFGF